MTKPVAQPPASAPGRDPCLGHLLAQAGVASRRQAAELVKAGRVTVAGHVETNPARRVASGTPLTLDGQPVTLPAATVAVMLNKPPGYTCTVRDPHAAHPVVELVALPGVRLYPVGRLDVASEGLLILTNDGDYAQRLLHPRHGICKTYLVTLDRRLTAPEQQRLLAGIEDEGEQLRVAQILPGSATTSYRMVLTEGRKREIRRLVKAVGCRVLRLCRVAIGELQLGDLPSGKWRQLTPRDQELSLRPGAIALPAPR